MRDAVRLAGVAVIAAILFQAERAWAPFHVVVVDQVFFGTADCPNAQYVMMRILSTGMGFIANQRVRTQNADGSAAPDFGTFSQNAGNSAAGDAFIMGTAEAAGLFGIAMDEEVDGTLVFPDGRVCFGMFGSAPVDCVAYGAFTGDNSGGGEPAIAPQLSMALMRQGNTQNGNDATDFVLAAPNPRNNDGVVGTLGQCPAGGPTPTATTVEATPTATGPPTGGCVGDCDGSGDVAINELITGVGIALGTTPLSSCSAFDPDDNGSVAISDLIAAVNNALNGCPP